MEALKSMAAGCVSAGPAGTTAFCAAVSAAMCTVGRRATGVGSRTGPAGAGSACASTGSSGTAGMAGGCGCSSSRSEEHTSELQSLMRISYAVFCLKKKKNNKEKNKQTYIDKNNTNINNTN